MINYSSDFQMAKLKSSRGQVVLNQNQCFLVIFQFHRDKYR